MAFWNKKVPGETKVPKMKKPKWREWTEAAVFAIVAATIIRTFIFEAYTIPTGSMEGSLLINDFLFVSKLSYGPRVPMTPLAVPLVHNSLPITGGKSYIESVQWKYRRLWAFGKVERNDVVVFNYPAGDTVMAERPADDYYSALRDEFNNDREAMRTSYHIIERPVDKEENYIKRCVAIPGDRLEVRDAILYINDKPANAYPHQKRWYTITTKNAGIGDYIDENDIESVARMTGQNNTYNLENIQAENIKKLSNVVDVVPFIFPKGMAEPGVYPQDTANFKWNRDNYGPITIPKEGVTVQLAPQNVAIYRRVIRNYEGNKLEEKDGKIYINDKEATSYTFKMDYYWMMGDNRHNSLDSRYWGFVPIDHVVGKAWLVWFSYNREGITHGLHWGRLFRTVHALEK